MKKNISLDRVASLYEIARVAKTTDVPVESSDLHSFYRALRKLRALTHNDVIDELWVGPVRILSAYLYSLLLAPVPFNLPGLINVGELLVMRDRHRIYEDSNPEAAALLAACLNTAESFLGRSDNPLFLAIRQAFPRGVGRGALLIRDSRLIAAVEILLRRSAITSGVRVVTAPQLKEADLQERLIIIGPSSWHPPFVARSKRAQHNVILRYAWLADQTSHEATFVGGWKSNDDVGLEPREPGEILHKEAFDGPEDFLAPVDWARIHHRGIASIGPAEIDRVSAKTLLLEGDFGVFLEDDPSVSVLVIDLDAEDAQKRVTRIPVSKLEPGQFVILRNSGEADFTVAFANQLMGDLATSLRAMQAGWKQRLREKVEATSLLEISIALLDRGSTRAVETNVRNWISARNIRTHDESDFLAILKLVGLDGAFEEYWNGMQTIARFHQRAGQQIRRQLLRKLRDSDLAVLERVGRLDIALSEGAEAGTLTAFRILAIDKGSRVVHFNELSRPFPIGGDYGSNASLQHF